MGRRALTPYLVKANDDLVSFCTCSVAPIAESSQLDCPWCGCGWLFTCMKCRKAFTFAKAVLIKETLQEIAERQVRRVQRIKTRSGEVKEIQLYESPQEWIEEVEPFLSGLEIGKMYVYFDGRTIPTDAERVVFHGQHRSHTLSYVPQVQALRDKRVRALLSDMSYWNSE